MKRIILVVIFFSFLVCSCSSPKWFLVNSSGIMTYNRHTGVLEVLWEWNEKPNPVATDSLASHVLIEQSN